MCTALMATRTVAYSLIDLKIKTTLEVGVFLQ